MIRFSAFLVAVAVGLLIAGVVTSKLGLVYIAIGVSGVALLALELASTCAWLFMGKGLIVLVKLAVLLMVPLFWEYRVPLLLLVVALASVGSHMPSRFRHRCFVPAARPYCVQASELSSQNRPG